MLTVGVTGGIGSGKSFVTQYFGELGLFVVDADDLAREVVASGQPALQKISAYFGEDVLLPSGELNRKTLRERIFADSSKKRWLEQLLHPLIRARATELLQQNQLGPYQIYSAPLLLEQNQQGSVDLVLVVDCLPELQVARASNRDSAGQQSIKAIMAQQLSREERIAVADYVVDNSGTKEQTITQLNHIHAQLLERARFYL